MKRKPRVKTIKIKPKIIGKSRRGNPIYDQNPFLTDFEVVIRKKMVTVGRGEELFNENDRYLGPGIIAKFIETDKEHFTKIYAQKMRNYFELSRAGYHLLMFIFNMLPEKSLGQDRIIFDYKTADRISKEMRGKGIGTATYSRAINELIQHRFLAEVGPPGVFYINPNLFFAGDRMAFAEVYCSGQEFDKIKKRIEQEIEKLPPAFRDEE